MRVFVGESADSSSRELSRVSRMTAARLRESANGCSPEFGGVCGVRQREAWPWRV